MHKQLNRRGFLAFGLGAVAAGVAGVVIGRSSYPGLIVSVLRTKLAYLDLDQAGLQRFARDFQENYSELRSSRWMYGAHILGLSRIVYEHTDIIDRTKFEDAVTLQYLLSSDFFLNDADERSVVKYIGYFSPNNGCRNPFARFD